MSAVFPGRDLSEPSVAMLALIGRFTLTWSVLEMGLDACATVIFHQFDGKQIEKESPKQLKRKVSFLRKCARRSAKLSQFKERLLDALDRVDTLTDMRHHLIHGAPESVTGDTINMVVLIHD